MSGPLSEGGTVAVQIGLEAMPDEVRDGVDSAKGAMKAVMKEAKKSDKAYQNEVASMEADAKEAVKDGLEDAVEEVEEALNEILEEMEDDFVPPLDMIVEMLAKCVPKLTEQLWTWLGNLLVRTPAFLHLVTIEFLPMWFFLFALRSTMTSFMIKAAESSEGQAALNEQSIDYVWGEWGENQCPVESVHLNYNQCEKAGAALEEGVWRGSDTNEALPRGCHVTDEGDLQPFYFNYHPTGSEADDHCPLCMKNDTMSASEWQQKVADCWAKRAQYLFDYRKCIDHFACVKGEDESIISCDSFSIIFREIVWIGYLLVGLLMGYVVISFVWRGLMCKQLKHGSYLKFCLDIKRTVAYRYIAGVMTMCAVLAVLTITIGTRSMFVFFVQNSLLSILITAMSMRSFTRPYRPKFSTVDGAEGSFSELLWRRQFFEGSSGFSSRLSSALLQATRLPRAKALRKMLCVAPQDEKEMARQVRQVVQICQKTSQVRVKAARDGCWGFCQKTSQAPSRPTGP